MTPPRNVPSWDEFYLGLAYYCASRSKDPATQCGALIADPHNIPLGFGCNGAPRIINDHEIDWSRPAKYPFMLHSEVNAIKHAMANRHIGVNGLDGCTLYVTGHPCSKCMLQIVDKGIRRICHGPLPIKMVDDEEIRLSKYIAASGKIHVEKFQGNLQWALLRTQFMEQLGLFREDIWEHQ